MSFTCDTTALRKSYERLGSISKRGKEEMVNRAAKGFTKRIIAISPPASEGVTGQTAKKAGENAIIGDLAKIMIAVSAAEARKAGNLDPAAIHKANRSTKTGRTKKVATRFPVARPAFNAFQRQQLARVGWLAAGWNAAASNTKTTVPAFIKRHSAGHGSYHRVRTSNRIAVTVENDAKFIGNVRDYDRRLNAAVFYQQKAMDREADFLLKKAIKKAGFS